MWTRCIVTCNTHTQSGESYCNLQAGQIDTISTWEAGESVSSMDEELSTKDAREGILGMIRATMSGKFTMPDPAMDVSECLLASMELGVKSVSWAMVTEWPTVRGVRGLVHRLARGLHGRHRVQHDQGMPVSCTSDGGPKLTAKVVEDMMRD